MEAGLKVFLLGCLIMLQATAGETRMWGNSTFSAHRVSDAMTPLLRLQDRMTQRNSTLNAPRASNAAAPLRRLQDPVSIGILCVASVGLITQFVDLARHWFGRRLSGSFYSCDATTCSKSEQNDWEDAGDHMVSPSTGKKCRKCTKEEISGHAVVQSSSGSEGMEAAFSIFPDHQVVGGIEGRSLADASILGGAAMLLMVMGMALRLRFRGRQRRALMEETSEPQVLE